MSNRTLGIGHFPLGRVRRREEADGYEARNVPPPHVGGYKNFFEPHRVGHRRELVIHERSHASNSSRQPGRGRDRVDGDRRAGSSAISGEALS